MPEQPHGRAAVTSRLLRPRSRPDLAAFTRTARFALFSDSACAAWCDSRLAKLEHGAPWLSRYGMEILDVCRTSFAQRGVMRRGVPG